MCHEIPFVYAALTNRQELGLGRAEESNRILKEREIAECSVTAGIDSIAVFPLGLVALLFYTLPLLRGAHRRACLFRRLVGTRARPGGPYEPGADGLRIGNVANLPSRNADRGLPVRRSASCHGPEGRT